MNKKYVVIDQRKREINQFRPFSESLSQVIQDQLMLLWTYHSNSIEGNTLTYKETSFYLLRGLTAKGRSLEEHLEILNHKDAVSFLESLVKDKNLLVTEKLIKEIHQVLFKNISKVKVGYPGRERTMSIKGGSYKDQDNHVLKADGSIHYYVPAISVVAEMEKLATWIRENWFKMHPIELAAKTHYELVRIHPFSDGNGRVARLVMNLILMTHDYPPAIIREDKKMDYYEALELADQGEIQSFLKIVEKELLESMELVLGILKGKAGTKKKLKHKLYEFRKNRELTQKRLSLLSGVEQSTLSKIENLKEKPQKETLRKLEKVLGLKEGELQDKEG